MRDTNHAPLRKLGSINALRAPIAPGNRIISGENLYLCDTDMGGRWKVYKNAGTDGSIHWQIEEEGIDGQVALICWLESQHDRE